VEPEAPPERQPVAIASVVRGLGGGGAVRITVHGAWLAAPDGVPAALLVEDGEERHEVRALPPLATGSPTEFHAVFDLPPALGGVSGDGLVLAVSGAEILLPPPLPSVPPAPIRDVTAEAPPVPAEVIDRAVLAEHRARRAETSLEGLSERLRTLEAHLGDVTADRDRLREELEEADEAEERRHASLQEQLARLHEAAEESEAAHRTAQREAQERIAAMERELADARAELEGARDELDVVREERDGLRDAVARADRIVHTEPAAGLAELGETARVLREQAEEELAARAPAEPPAEQDPFDLALAGLRARTQPQPLPAETADDIAFDPLRNTMDLAAMSPGRRARSRLRRVAPSDRRVVHGDNLAAGRRSGVAWLRGAVELFAADDIRGAGAFVLALLPDIARTLEEDIVFDVELEHVGAFRVTLRDGAGSVAPLEDGSPGDPEFRISGPVTVIAPLATGGAPRRLGGARVTGSRRALRRVLRTRRDPVDLGDLAGAGVVPDPSLLLRAVASAVRPSWTGDEEYAVVVDVPDLEPITIVSEPGKRLQVVGPPPEGGAVRVVVTTSADALLALLGRVAPPDGDDAWVSGEEDVMTELLELLDRAQGLPRRG
jgi:hypothetical protein